MAVGATVTEGVGATEGAADVWLLVPVLAAVLPSTAGRALAAAGPVLAAVETAALGAAVAAGGGFLLAKPERTAPAALAEIAALPGLAGAAGDELAAAG